MTSIAKKFATATVAAAAMGATLALSAAPAEAKFGRKGAFFGGLAAGIIGGAIAASAAPRYYESAPVHCWTKRRPVYNRWGDFRGYRYYRVCR